MSSSLATATAVDRDPEEAPGPLIDCAEIYRRACAELQCRANSAVLRTLAGTQTMRTLSLRSNYIGPRGLGPILVLVQRCQALEALDLAGNGLDNASCARLCAVAADHLGLRSLDLSDNPLTNDAGPDLMNLMRSNPRIGHVRLGGTDIFAAVVDRIVMEADANRARMDPTIEVLAQRPAGDEQRPGSRPATRSARVGSARPVAVRVPAQKAADTNVVFTPKPPLPALAANTNASMARDQRFAVRELYRQRQAQYLGEGRSEAGKAASIARYQLAMLEAADRPPTEQPQLAIADNATADPTPHPNPPPQREENPAARRKRASISEEVPEPRLESSVPAAGALESTGGENSDALVGGDSPEESSLNNSSVPLRGAVFESSDGRTVYASRDPSAAPFVVPRTTEEEFKALFEAGCDAYKRKNHDAAYLRWSEAMAFAAETRNREWISIVTNNLQRLSYELLVAEGMRHMEAARLDEADRSFAFALDVAKKARNALWTADMAKARRNVQHAVFQHTHERATQLFEQAARLAEEEVTADDVFVAADGVSVTAHTTAFYNEWQRQLLLKEALEGWVDASAVVRSIGGPSARVLQDVVASAVQNVALFLIRHFFCEAHNTNTAVLPRQRTALYAFEEARSMQALWTELAHRTEPLNCPALQAAIFGQVGHLCLATNQIAAAAQYFDAMVGIAQTERDPCLSAVAHTYLALAHWQRNNFGSAEKCAAKAVEVWGHMDSTATDAVLRAELERQADVPVPASQPLPNHRALQQGPLVLLAASRAARDVPEPIPQALPAAGAEPPMVTLAELGTALQKSALYREAPASVLSGLHAESYQLLVSVLLATHRFHEALAVLERGLQRTHRDALWSKVRQNFSAAPTVDHVAAAAAGTKSTIVYMRAVSRHTWNPNTAAYDREEHAQVWAVPSEGELKYISLNVTADFGAPSIDALVEEARQAMCVGPMDGVASTGSSDVAVELASLAWTAPLRTLHSILMAPVLGYVQAHGAYSADALVTLVPVGSLWAVPFPALLDKETGQFLVEQVAIQMAFCATYCTFSALNSVQCRQRDMGKAVFLVTPADDTLGPGADAMHPHLTFPLDAARAAEEARVLSDVVAASAMSQGRHAVRRHLLASTTSEARDILPGASLVHVSAPCVSGLGGGICLGDGCAVLDLLRPETIADTDLYAGIVTLTNTQVDPRLLLGPTEGTVRLVRAFLAAGCPCVLAALWCTPDMLPEGLLADYYAAALGQAADGAAPASPTGGDDAPKSSTRKRPSAPRTLLAQAARAPARTNKALALARSIRALIADDHIRYSPRHWGGFFIVGVGE